MTPIKELEALRAWIKQAPQAQGYLDEFNKLTIDERIELIYLQVAAMAVKELNRGKADDCY